MRKTIGWAIGGSIGIVALGVLAYIIKFYSLPWSNDPAVWGQLGDYLNMFVSAANLILIFALTYTIYQADSHRAAEQGKAAIERANSQDEEERARNRPVLVFMVVRDEMLRIHWKVRNISNNVALNVLISFSQAADDWKKPVMVYSLGANQEVKLTWIKGAYQLRAVYYDIKDNVLTATMQGDWMKIDPGLDGFSQFQKDQYMRLEDAEFTFMG